MRLSSEQLQAIRDTRRSVNTQRGAANMLNGTPLFAGIPWATIYSAVRRLDRQAASQQAISNSIKEQVETSAAHVC